MLNKTCMLGLVTITAAFGFISSPARADNAAAVDQSSGQYTTQIGHGNASVSASDQTGVISQQQAPYGGGLNGAALGQYSSQDTLQRGYGNTSVSGTSQAGKIDQGHSYSRYPYNSNINAAELKQGSGQGVGQLGAGNTAIQGSDQSSFVHQH